MKTSGDTSGAGNKGTFRRTVTRWDMGLLIFLAFLTVGSLYSFRLLRPGANDVWISVNGRTLGFYSLKEEKTIRVKGPIGTTVIRIHNGQAAITEAPCAHKFCQKMGPIPAHGNVMICIPNRIVVEIKNRKGRETDAITR